MSDPLAQKIATELERLMLYQTHFLIIERKDSPFYAQFIPTDLGELYCEAVGNHYLDPDSQIDGEAELRLIELGWSSTDDFEDPNFKQLWDEPIPFAEVGERMARTLVEVFGVRDLADVTFTLGERTSGH